jgi:hypothetical protein
MIKTKELIKWLEASSGTDVYIDEGGLTLYRSCGAGLEIGGLDDKEEDGFGAWPWCEPCRSYHHPDNPTCVAKKGEPDGIPDEAS